jgi:hypothetical protein
MIIYGLSIKLWSFCVVHLRFHIELAENDFECMHSFDHQPVLHPRLRSLLLFWHGFPFPYVRISLLRSPFRRADLGLLVFRCDSSPRHTPDAVIPSLSSRLDILTCAQIRKYALVIADCRVSCRGGILMGIANNRRMLEADADW